MAANLRAAAAEQENAKAALQQQLNDRMKLVYYVTISYFRFKKIYF